MTGRFFAFVSFVEVRGRTAQDIEERGEETRRKSPP